MSDTNTPPVVPPPAGQEDSVSKSESDGRHRRPDESEIQLDVPSTAARDLEVRLNDDSPVPVFLQSVNPSLPDEDGYAGTDDIYKNRANETDQPRNAEDGAFKQAEDAYIEAAAGDAQEPSDALKDTYNAVKAGYTGPEGDGKTVRSQSR